MNRVICVKGHFYDGDKYEECPHCAAGVEAIRQDPFSVRRSEAETEEEKGGKAKRERGGLFHRREKKPTMAETTFLPADSVEETVLLQENAEETPQQSVSPSLREAFAASAQTEEGGDEGKTVGYFSVGRTEPPVGYLICTAGEDYGVGFLLKSGSNSLGRSASMDVTITDGKVSREKQAFVLYEPMKREFYLKPGEGAGLCYLNGELVLGPVKMKAFDLIGMGDTRLMLVPVCCEKFSWEEAR